MFLLSTLLLPTTPVSSAPPANPNLHTPTAPAPAEPIYDNSHAAHLHNPARTSTSETTLDAVRVHGIVDAVISALTSPVPYGEDGDVLDSDVDFEEKGVRLANLAFFSSTIPSPYCGLADFCTRMPLHVGVNSFNQRKTI